MSLDFTFAKYKELCEAIVRSGYVPMTVRDYLEAKERPPRLVVLRHDVDRNAIDAMKMARVENKIGIKATYYFRFRRRTFKPVILREIAAMGHETGYHYEALDKAKGDPEKALRIFRDELDAFRRIVDVRTISMHGNPLTRWDNRDLWRDHDFKDLGILGEAYLSIGSDIIYLSDTGRTWGSEFKMKDWLVGEDGSREKEPVALGVHTTDDLARLIEGRRYDRLYLNTHPGRWTDSSLAWTSSLLEDALVNVVKRLLVMSRFGKDPKVGARRLDDHATSKKRIGTYSMQSSAGVTGSRPIDERIPKINPLVVMIDLDEWYHCRWATGSKMSRWRSISECFHDSYESDGPVGEIVEPTKWILECLGENNTKVTFNILGEVAQWYPDLVKQIAQEGHDIACHGMHHQDLTLITRQEFSRDLARARQILEELSGRRVVGFRAPNLVVTEWLSEVLIEQGFVYDSSVAPTRIPRKSKGQSGAPTQPYRTSTSSLFLEGRANLVEIPVSVFPIIKVPGGTSITTRALGWTWTRITLDSALRSGPACFYAHPYEFNAAHKLKNMRLSERVFLMRTGTYMKKILPKLINRYQERIVTAEYFVSHMFPIEEH